METKELEVLGLIGLSVLIRRLNNYDSLSKKMLQN